MSEKPEDAVKEKPESAPVTSATAPGESKSTPLQVLKAVYEFFKYYGLLFPLLVADVVAVQQFDERMGIHNLWWTGAVGAAPFILILLWLTPKWLAARNAKRMKELGYTGEVKAPYYFKLVAYTQKSDFQRADTVQDTIYEWITTTKEPLLYLSGKSGSGKSSIISGWVIPSINEAKLPLHVVAVRVVDDPISAIKQTLLHPGVVWERLPSETEGDFRALLQKCVRKLAPKTLILVLDQFEEFLILTDDEQRGPFTDVLQSLAATPILGLRMLMILRSDYLGLLEKLRLPLLDQNRNWKEVPPFLERDAMNFLRGSRLKLSPELEAAIVDEAREVEDTKGTIRPITINLFGLLLSQYESLPKHYRPSALLRTYLADLIRHKDLRDIAPVILRAMITPNWTKLPVQLDDVAKTTALDVNQLRGCLVQLGNAGMVRELDRVSGRWEISHDFIASLYGRILAGWRETFWRRARPWVITSGIALWFLAVIAVPILLQDRLEIEATNRLYKLGFHVQGYSPDRTLVSSNLNDNQLGEALAAIRSLSFKSLDLSDSKVTDVDGLKGLTALQTLNLSNSKVTNVDGLKGLTALQTLNLSDSKVTDVEVSRLRVFLPNLSISY